MLEIRCMIIDGNTVLELLNITLLWVLVGNVIDYRDESCWLLINVSISLLLWYDHVVANVFNYWHQCIYHLCSILYFTGFWFVRVLVMFTSGSVWVGYDSKNGPAIKKERKNTTHRVSSHLLVLHQQIKFHSRWAGLWNSSFLRSKEWSIY